MSLVHELLRTIERENVLTVLRRAKELAATLGVEGINRWLQCELGGYDIATSVPKYRIVSCQLTYTNSPLPVGYSSEIAECSSMPSQDWILRQSIPELLESVEGAGVGQSQFWPTLNRDELIRVLKKLPASHFTTHVSFSMRVDVARLRTIPEAVKECVHEWAVELVRRGVLGDKMTFNEKEKAEAHNITFNISNSQIEQLNNMGQNTNTRNG